MCPARTADGSAQRRDRDQYHAGLSRELVVAAAVDLLRQEGPEAFSLRRLAAELNVDPMALYKHVSNKDDLIGAALARVFANARPAGSGTWWEQVRAAFSEHRRAVRAEPWALTFLVEQRTTSAEPWAGVEELLTLLEPRIGAGAAARWVRWLAAYTNGFLLTEPDLHKPVDTRALSAQRPGVGTAAARNAGSADEDFDGGLDRLITCLRQDAGES